MRYSPSVKRTSRKRATSLRIETAFHEAGHAVVGLIFGNPIGQLTIHRKGSVLGSYEGALDAEFGIAIGLRKDEVPPPVYAQLRTGAELAWMGLLAGIAAEVIRDPKAHRDLDLLDNHKGSGDVSTVRNQMAQWDRPSTGGPAAARWLDAQEECLVALFQRTARLLKRKDVWHAVELIAGALLQYSTLSQAQVRDLNRQLLARLKRVLREERRKVELDVRLLARPRRTAHRVTKHGH